MKRVTIYQDYGKDLQLQYINGILHSAIRMSGRNDHYAKLVCYLAYKEEDIDLVVFKLVLTRFDVDSTLIKPAKALNHAS